ncbi:PVC-type heme-binding CxxCH protein [Compostibacter hankyongensis]|uniref:DUF7133 domain-containing protein n=1 Tax=Compostibacter hankyongensis TaxID=1007089 RepID=A0ABP8G9F7_9BACT
MKKARINPSRCLLFLAVTAVASCTTKSRYPGPLPAEESMKTFHFADDFKAEIFATEPLVADPVSMTFDEAGNAYVVEMPDANMEDSAKGKCRIVLLKDTNGDGRADKSVIFADRLNEATSVLPWKGGLFVAAAPTISYFKDTDGDGKADSKKIVFSGFFKNNDEAQITSLTFGVDNWIYANNDGQAGKVRSASDTASLSMQGADFRFRPDRDQFELSTGPGQFGQAIDDWGHRFFSQNTLHIRQVVIPVRYLRRNPAMPPSAQSAVINVSDHDPLMYQLTPAPYWRAERTKRRNQEYQEHHLDRVEYEKGHFSGGSGGTFYGGDAFPEAYYGNIFTGDVSGNLVHRDILAQPSGDDPFYTAKRGDAEKDKEFMAATDSWVRPTSFAVGPDGALYMIDMYRQHIETPVSIPEDLQTDMDFRAGSNMGRIYRIVPKNAGAYKKPDVDLQHATAAELVKLLSHPSSWWALQAHRLLLERQDKTVIPALKDLFAQSKDPRSRLHALYLLEGLNALDAGTVALALKDSAAGVRENAVQLAERFPACLPQLKEMVRDSSFRVAFQATLSLGNFPAAAVAPALADVVERHGENSWYRTAVLSSAAGSSPALLKILMQKGIFRETAPWKEAFLGDLSYVTGGRNEKEQTGSLLALLQQPALATATGEQAAAVKGLISGLLVAKTTDTAQQTALKSLKTENADDIKNAIQDLTKLYGKSSQP